jgi:single-stranded-DNA-specific exonuclease
MIDGYGVSMRALEHFKAKGIATVLTCDVGFSAVDEVRRAVDDLGMEVLITDHHLPPDVLPKAHVLVNPHQAGCPYPFKDLCGVGVAYKVLQALAARLGLDPAATIEKHLDLVALGTICDIVPLVDENRIFAKKGVERMKETENLGLRMLLAVAEVRPEAVTEMTCGWVLGPRLNAVGRINDAGKGLQLLISQGKEDAAKLAREIDALNTERKTMSKAIEASAIRQLDPRNLDDVYGITLFGDDNLVANGTPGDASATLRSLDTTTGISDPKTPWHHGVIGIVASKVVERYGRPTFLFAFDEESQKWKGSGRAPNIHGIHLKDALSACKSHMHKFGGHEYAAGATLVAQTPEELAAFAADFNAAIRAQMRPEDRTPLLKADLQVKLEELTENLHRILGHFAPFGHSNEGIKMMAEDVEVISAKVIGQDRTHLKLVVKQGEAQFDALAWGFATKFPEMTELPMPYRADIFFKLETNEFRGKTSLQLVVDDVRLPRIQALAGITDTGLLSPLPAGAAATPSRTLPAGTPVAPVASAAPVTADPAPAPVPAAVRTVRSRAPAPSDVPAIPTAPEKSKRAPKSVAPKELFAGSRSKKKA